MNWLVDSPWWLWLGAAVVVFWFIGAYNRIVRLRSAALQAYAALDAALVRQLEFVQAQLAVGEGGTQAETRAALEACAAQFATLLGATRARPLDPAGIGGLGTALHVLLAAWRRQHPDAVISFEADGTLSRPATLPGRDDAAAPAATMAWPEPSPAAEIARSQFNLAVAQYNAAIAQFPAVLVAWIMQLPRAAPLR